MQNLPIGISSFSRIRENNYLYIDKTEYLYNLITTGTYYFLSRPRRFGKSLLVSTLRCLFEGKRELFKGLWIYDRWDWSRFYPVIHIDFNAISCDEPVQLKEKLLNRLYDIGTEHGIEVKNNTLPECFEELILKINKKYKEEVVFLIDEYDRPIINHIGMGEGRLEIAKANREVLRTFYGVIKAGDVQDVTRFVLLTGVSKFSKVSVFSELNNLTDLTMHTRYWAILGITEEELERYLVPYIEEYCRHRNIALEEGKRQLREYYNGYRFSEEGESVYNPYSLLRCLEERKIGNWWFETGTPTVLVNLIKETQYPILHIEDMKLKQAAFSTYEIEDLRIEALLFQTGYITIKNERNGIYQLGYPNKEVKTSFLDVLFEKIVGYRDPEKLEKRYFIEEKLEQGDLQGFIDIIKAIYSGIPYTLEYKLNEAHFHTLFYVMLSSMGIRAETEVLTSRGRIDMVVEIGDKIYIIEFKCNQESEKAIEQIKENRYADRYRKEGKELYLIGINFSTQGKNIADWKFERI